jgi:hypothetical protein
MFRVFAVAALSVFTALPASAQAVTSALIGKDGRVEVVFANNNAAKTFPAEKGQVACENVRVAPDKRTVAWSVLIENCCTSYPVPVKVVVYREAKKAVISPGQMVWDWRFTGRGDRIAILSGPVHGRATAAYLYDARTGKQLQSWNGVGSTPGWARGWERQFGNQSRGPE